MGVRPGGQTQDNTANSVASIDGCELQSGMFGQLTQPISVATMNPQLAGYGFLAAGDYLYALGGSSGGGTSPGAENLVVKHSGTAPGLTGMQGFDPGLDVDRTDLAAALQSGWIYVLGGTTSGGAARTTEYILY